MGCNSTRILQVGGTASTYTVQVDTPNIGDITITDNAGGNTFVIPNLLTLTDGDGDTRIDLIEGGAAVGGGDRMDFVVDGTVVGGVEFTTGGLAKWTFNDILDPTLFRPTGITTAVRDATFTPIAQRGDLIFNTDNDQWEEWDGVASWQPFRPVSATEGVEGIVFLASQAEVTTGTDAVKVVTPATLKVELDKKINGSDIQDDDTFASASANDVASSESIKAYVDGLVHPDDDVEGVTGDLVDNTDQEIQSSTFLSTHFKMLLSMPRLVSHMLFREVSS